MRFGIRELVFVGLMLGLLGSTYVFVFKKSNVRRDQKVAEIQSMDKSLANLRRATTGIDDMNRKISELQQAISFFQSKLPQEREVDKILKEVWQMAEANSLQTKTVKTLKSEYGPSYSEQPIQMSLSGDFRGYYAFLLQLEKLPRITRVTQMKLEKINERDGEMQAQMTLSIFFEPDTRSSAVSTN
ncbi:MAG: type 4a pilus biogenesis protein PilO [Tepidisphaeraceae bacterium]